MDGTLSDLTIQAAARWYARLQALDCSAADRAEFGRWCAEEPAHAAAYALACDTAAGLASLFRSDPALRERLTKAVAATPSVPARARLGPYARASRLRRRQRR